MAFRKKANFILKHQPDILIVPECEHPNKLKFNSNIPVPNDIVWYGSNTNKGIGVFSYGSYKFKLLDVHNPNLKNVLPIRVTGGKIKFTLFAVWANNPHDRDGHYVTQIWKALHCYENLLSSKTILIGDFNSNKIWDRPRREGNHSKVVEKLKTKKIFSAYHEFHKEEQGKEQRPTFFLYRHENRPYHMDYCFASAYFIKRLINVEVGNYQEWRHLSDHSPLTVTFDL